MGSRSPAPVTYIPKTQAATVFQPVVSEEDFGRATQYIQDLKTERETAKSRRYAEIGTPEEIGRRMRERDAKTETAYLASLPREEIDYTAGLQPSILNNIENFLQDLPARRLGRRVDPVPNLRNIQSQIVNRRADEANLNRPEGTAQVATPSRMSLSEISDKYGQFSTFGHKDYQAAKQQGYSDAEIKNYLDADMSRLHPDNRPGGSAGLYDEIKKGKVDLSKAVNIVR